MNINDLQVKLFKALSHPIRLKIVKKLIENNMCVCELTGDIEFSQSNLSQHLKILKDAGILVSRKEGLRVNYEIYNNRIKDIIILSEKIVKENLGKFL